MENLIRIKWNRLKSNLTLSEIAFHIKSNKYSEEFGYGYSDVDVSTDVLSATYTEAKLNKQTSIDPLGNENEQEFITYESIQFSISKLIGRLYLLTVYNPPKSIKALTERLSADSGYKIGFGIVDIKLSEYLDSLREKYDLNLFSIKKMKVSNLIVNDNSKATVEIISKKNAFDDVKDLIGDKAYSLDKVKAAGYVLGNRCEFEMSKNGSVCVNESMVKYLTETIVYHILDREI